MSAKGEKVATVRPEHGAQAEGSLRVGRLRRFPARSASLGPLSHLPIQSIATVSLKRASKRPLSSPCPCRERYSFHGSGRKTTCTVDLAGDTEKRTCDTMRSPRKKKEEKREKQKREKRSDKLPISGFKNHYKLPMVGGFRTLHRK